MQCRYYRRWGVSPRPENVFAQPQASLQPAKYGTPYTTNREQVTGRTEHSIKQTSQNSTPPTTTAARNPVAASPLHSSHCLGYNPLFTDFAAFFRGSCQTMDKTYQPHAIEATWYQNWESNLYFAPQGSGRSEERRVGKEGRVRRTQ